MASNNTLDYKRASSGDLVRRANDISSRSGRRDDSEVSELKNIQAEEARRKAATESAISGKSRLTTQDKKY